MTSSQVGLNGLRTEVAVGEPPTPIPLAFSALSPPTSATANGRPATPAMSLNDASTGVGPSSAAAAIKREHSPAKPRPPASPAVPATPLNAPPQFRTYGPTILDDEPLRVQPDEPHTPALQQATADHAVHYPTATMDVFYQHAAAMNGMPLNGNISLMLALAQLSTTQLPHQSTVSPAQVSLPLQLDDSGNINGMNGQRPDVKPATTVPNQGLESFARIEFADSVFQMTTYAVIIGRDQRALEQARRDERRADEYQRRVEQRTAMGLPPPSPPNPDRGKFSKSYVSEEGGMLGPESDSEENPRPSKRRKTGTGSSGSQGLQQHQQHQPAPPPPQQQEDMNMDEQVARDEKNQGQELISDRQYVSHTPGAAAVDLAALTPSPYHVPFLGIHSPGPNIAANTKAISREHLKIQFNQETGVFEAIPLHKNGFFREDVHYRDEKVVLRSGDRLQIKDVEFAFLINGVKHGKTGAEDVFEEEETASKRYSEGGKEMSFEFESSHGGEIHTSDEEEDAEKVESENEEPEAEEGDGEGEDDVLQTVESDLEESLEPMPLTEPHPLDLPPKKRGPGRPPKNGIRSKREERLLKKQAQELAKKTLPQPSGEPPVKRKVGRPRKHPLPDDSGDRPEKRKYKPRKPKNEDGGEGSEGEKVVKEKRREKPKTPPLELKMEDFTEEQLQKPNKNYGVLIDEVLSDAPPEGLTLKQIYKRIQKSYPYYFFVVDTKGWESSVRHNLIGNDAFKKNEETHLWCRVPGIELDAGKKRKATSPDQPPSAMHGLSQYSHHMAHPPYHGESMGAGVQGYQQPTAMPPPHGYPPPGQQPYAPQQAQQNYTPAAPSAAGNQAPQRQAYPLPSQAPAPAQLPGYGPSVAARQLSLGGQSSSYSSPYASKPPPPSTVSPPIANLGAVAQPQNYTSIQLPNMQQPGYQPGQNVHAPPADTATPGQVAHAANGTSAPLKPAVDPVALTFIKNFKNQVITQLEKRTPKAEAIAMSVINRGLGLATDSVVPEHEGIENVVFGVFQTTLGTFPKTQAAISAGITGPDKILDPGLTAVLTRFKSSMVETLKPKLGQLKAEALLLSAIGRVLGFTERSMAQADNDAERKEFDDAENVLMPAIKSKVLEFQRSQQQQQPVTVAVPSGTTLP